MPTPDKLWKLLLLLLLVPPVGALLMCVSDCPPRWLKLTALAYCAAAILFLLLYRPSAAPVIIDAQRWSAAIWR